MGRPDYRGFLASLFGRKPDTPPAAPEAPPPAAPQDTQAEETRGEIGHLTAQRVGSGPASWGERHWHSGPIRRYPENPSDFHDFPTLFRDWIADGLAPEQPLLNRDDTIVTLGSCFAAELRHFLNEVGFSSDSVWVPSGLNNTFAIRDFVSWCITGEQTATGYRYDRDDETGVISEWQPDFERQKYRGHFEKAGAFVFTLGLAEVWEDKETGAVFWRGVPEHIFQQGRHEFRLSTVEQNLANLEHLIQAIRQANPGAPIIFTLSPVPLKATFRPMSCMTADAVSKSILRVALDLLMQQKLPGVYYWPSFEMVKWVGCHVEWPSYGMDDDIVRHVSRHYVINIIDTFVRCFYSADSYSLFTERLHEKGYERTEAGYFKVPGTIVTA